MARDYCFTAWEKPKYDADKLKYICWGEEVCPTTGKLHYQGYVTFTRTHRMTGAKLILGSNNIHMEMRRGTREQARDYCFKDDGEHHEEGEFEAISTTDLFKKPIPWLKENYPAFYCRYHKGLKELQSSGPDWRDLQVIWIDGPSGCGKTRSVMEQGGVFKLDPPFRWWDGYQGEETLLLDDLDEGAIGRGPLLNILDGYKLRLDVKGSHTWAAWTKVYITSNYPVWEDTALRRRITEIVHLGGVTV